MYGNTGPENQTQQYVHQPTENEVNLSPASNTQYSVEEHFDFEAVSQTPDIPPSIPGFRGDETLLAKDDDTAQQCVTYPLYIWRITILTAPR